ncbi:MAG: lipocalin family protein [Ginsengibacter sp.]
MKLSTYFFVALIATSLFSCKKDNTTKTCSLSEANLAGTYKIAALKYKASASSPEVDGSSMVDACSLDNLQTFKPDYSLISTDAGVKCDPSDDDSSTWSLSGTTLIVDGDNNDITAFDCAGFTINQPDFKVAGDSFIITFKKQ